MDFKIDIEITRAEYECLLDSLFLFMCDSDTSHEGAELADKLYFKIQDSKKVIDRL